MSEQETCKWCGETLDRHIGYLVAGGRKAVCAGEVFTWEPGPTHDQLSAALRSAEKREREALQVSRRMEDALELIASCMCARGSFTPSCTGEKKCVVCIAHEALKGTANAK